MPKTIAGRGERRSKRAKRKRAAPTLGALLARYAREGKLGPDMSDRPRRDRPLGDDVE